MSGSRASAISVSRSEASLPFTRPGPGDGAIRLASSASTVPSSQVAVAPAQLVERLEAVRLHRGDDLVREVGAVAGGAERAVAHAPPGAAGDLGDLGGGEAAEAMAVELAHAGEGDVVDVHVQAHADRIGGDQEIDLLAPDTAPPGRCGCAG